MTVSTGVISTIAGTGTASYSGDNSAATSATLNNPHGVSLDSSGMLIYSNVILIFALTVVIFVGNVFISDYNNVRVRKVTVSTGIITTFAGNTLFGGYAGDGGAASSATLNSQYSVAHDSSGFKILLVYSIILH